MVHSILNARGTAMMWVVRLLSFLLYQVGWFCCVLGAAFSRPWFGAALALFLVGVHLGLTTHRAAQLKSLLLAVGVGLVTDTVLLGIGVFRFDEGVLVDWLPPVWMSVLWMQFATTFRYCLRWLSGRYMLSAALGFLGAPLAFLGGEQLGAIFFLPPRVEHLLILGAVWSVAIPLLILASDRLHPPTAELSYRGFESPA